jgi:predicted alpha/beta hydrolase family esterase
MRKHSSRNIAPILIIPRLNSNDPYCGIQHAQKLARRWRARFINAGLFGHLDADSGIGEWRYGLSLLDTLKYKGNPINNPALVAHIESLRAQRRQAGYFV